MKVVVLAGGRGKRMGTLTKNNQKATVCFEHKPLIVHVLDQLLQEPFVSDVTILTGYQGIDVTSVVKKTYGKSSRLSFLDFPETTGTLSRLVSAFSCLKVRHGYCVCGIDSLVSPTAFKRFCTYVNSHQNDTVLTLSPRTSIAPTHKIAYVNSDKITDLITQDSLNKESRELQWFTDVGIRYFPAGIMAMLQHRSSTQEKYIPSFVKELLLAGTIVRGFVFGDIWKHFATIDDLYSTRSLK
jgi:NDP-sugar pyrophosphorylase family protein